MIVFVPYNWVSFMRCVRVRVKVKFCIGFSYCTINGGTSI